MVHPNTGGNNCASPSSRRAWIEIFFPLALYVNFTVALLAEGVDRNSKRSNKAAQGDKSPSSRRAWIEIRVGDRVAKLQAVALLAEGVDRNLYFSS